MSSQKPDQILPTVSPVLGIPGIVLFCYCGLPFGIAALITGCLGINNANNNQTKSSERGMEIAVLILGAISILSLVVFIIFAFLER